jgi:hypothetical protein
MDMTVHLWFNNGFTWFNDDYGKLILGKIMNMGNTFVRIGSSKFLAAFFRPKDRIFVSSESLTSNRTTL